MAAWRDTKVSAPPELPALPAGGNARLGRPRRLSGEHPWPCGHAALLAAAVVARHGQGLAVWVDAPGRAPAAAGHHALRSAAPRTSIAGGQVMAEPIEQAPERVRAAAAAHASDRDRYRAEAREAIAKWKRGEPSGVVTLEELLAELHAHVAAAEDC